MGIIIRIEIPPFRMTGHWAPGMRQMSVKQWSRVLRGGLVLMNVRRWRLQESKRQ
ncbi:MAG TPA: hypothetical protein VMZ52_16420 [Bryobacteraceae bacterium]|nr:hypothetical protein [Bryobacteraceae bacterium]